jgi:hypothetical protein
MPHSSVVVLLKWPSSISIFSKIDIQNMKVENLKQRFILEEILANFGDSKINFPLFLVIFSHKNREFCDIIFFSQKYFSQIGENSPHRKNKGFVAQRSCHLHFKVY